MLSLSDKQAIVADVREVAESSLSVVIVEYSGLSVVDVTALRAQARGLGVCLRVVRNTLSRRALGSTQFACAEDALVGPVMLAFSREEPGAAARLLRAFVKENAALKVKALVLGDQLLNADALDAVADLPNREAALSMLLAVMQAPVEQLVRTLNEINVKLVRVISAVKDQKNG